MPDATIPVEIHPKFLPLIRTPHTVADIHGGRGGMKSTQVQLVALLEAMQRPMRVCEARETMSSIKDSSHKMLSELIYKHQMSTAQNGPYRIMEDRILREDGGRAVSEFIFVGVRENVRDQKSLVGINLTIFEEAAKASQDSLDVFMPTVLREENSKMWFIWNPELVTDPTYRLLILKPPTGTIHIETSYLENPWLSTTMRQLAEDCKRDTPEKYEHIWLGQPISNVEGAIFSSEIKKALAEGRIGEIPYNRTLPVQTAWDLGRDCVAIWFFQPYDGFINFIDYYEIYNHELTISDFVVMLQSRGYVYGTDWLPWDGIDAMLHRNMTGDRSKSIEMLMMSAGRRPRTVPKFAVLDRINAARTEFPRCRFNATKCAEGIEALKHYQWAPVDDKLSIPGKEVRKGRGELHNWASHGSSAFCGASIAARQPATEESRAPVAPPQRWDDSSYSPYA